MASTSEFNFMIISKCKTIEYLTPLSMVMWYFYAAIDMDIRLNMGCGLQYTSRSRRGSNNPHWVYSNFPPFDSNFIFEQGLMLCTIWWLYMQLKVDTVSIVYMTWSKVSWKWGVHALCEDEFHTLETCIIRFWSQWWSMTAALAFSASDHNLSDSIPPRY